VSGLFGDSVPFVLGRNDAGTRAHDSFRAGKQPNLSGKASNLSDKKSQTLNLVCGNGLLIVLTMKADLGSQVLTV
jgi:hypothetical protein